MPQKKYTAISLRELTSPPRSPVSFGWEPTAGSRRLFTYNDGPSLRDRGPLTSLTTGEELLELPSSCPLRPFSRRALEAVRFGDFLTALEISQLDSLSSYEATPEIFISSETDFPPLRVSSTTGLSLLDHKTQHRGVAASEALFWPAADGWQSPSFWSRGSHLVRKSSIGSAQSCTSSFDERPVSETSVGGLELCQLGSCRTRRDSKLDLEGLGVPNFRDDMASAYPQMSGDARRHYSSGANRYENRAPVNRQTPCKNGPLCRKFQEGTCPFNHDFSSMPANGLSVPKKSFNVESPAFTPKMNHAQPAGVQSPRSIGLSPKAAAAATFTPRGSGSVTPASISHSKAPSTEFIPQNFQPSTGFQEFVPQNFVQLSPQQLDHQPSLSSQVNPYADPFLSQQALQALESTQQSLNPYADQQPGIGAQAFYQDATSFRHPLNYHLYASLGPRREQLSPFQRHTTDFFIPDDLREDLQRKSEATLQTFPNSTLPQNVDNHFHSLVALDSVTQRTSATYGYPSWIYKATSSIDGNTYALRRVEGFRLTSDQAINTKNLWKKVNSSSIVRVIDAFTTQAFGDRSLVVVTDYHPLAQTLADKHFTRSTATNRPNQFTPESELWGYLVQIASALRAIHQNDLAARTIVPSKVLLTAKNRVRLSGCSVLDIVQFEQQLPTAELQQADLQDLGRLVLDIATRNPTAHNNPAKALEQISRNYHDKFRACLQWLLFPPQQEDHVNPEGSASIGAEYTAAAFLSSISDQVVNVFESTLARDDELTSNLMKETENGRLVRLLTKLNAILERPESSAPGSQTSSAHLNQPSSAWSETGERYYLKLFRDYVFHQVDHEGRPVLDFGHIVTCLNKLDAGIDERIQLVSRDEQNILVVSYRDVKRGFEAAWGELSRGSHAGRR